jgi:hypothetical protein
VKHNVRHSVTVSAFRVTDRFGPSEWIGLAEIVVGVESFPFVFGDRTFPSPTGAEKYAEERAKEELQKLLDERRQPPP